MVRHPLKASKKNGHHSFTFRLITLKGNITVEDLAGVMRSLGQEYTLFELEEVIKQIGAGKKEGSIQFSGTSSIRGMYSDS